MGREGGWGRRELGEIHSKYTRGDTLHESRRDTEMTKDTRTGRHRKDIIMLIGLIRLIEGKLSGTDGGKISLPFILSL